MTTLVTDLGEFPPDTLDQRIPADQRQGRPANAQSSIWTPGVYHLSEADYHADTFLKGRSLSSSGARTIVNECPAKFDEESRQPFEPTVDLNLGKAAHQWLLEGNAWEEKFEALPEGQNGTTKAGKALVQDIKDSGRVPLKFDQFEIIKGMHKALVAHPFAHAAFQNGRAEQSLYWLDPAYRIVCRARPDYTPEKHRIIADYKTTRSADPAYLRRAMYDYGYHQQADWYLDGINALGLIEDPKFLFVFQEKKRPYLVTCATPDEEALAWAKIQNHKAREVFARCLDTGNWPGYADDIITLGLPQYAAYQLTERSERGDFATGNPTPENGATA
jgi:hypothetical protein